MQVVGLLIAMSDMQKNVIYLAGYLINVGVGTIIRLLAAFSYFYC
jgi:hypothetical protein